jgi:hypothetical protein
VRDVRATLTQLADDRGESLASLSRLIGRNAAYLQQYIERGTPKQLAENDRLTLAQFFQVDERLLGARDPWTPAG